MTKLEPIVPGEILLTEFMEPMGVSRNGLAKATGMPLSAISKIVAGTRSITAESAVRLAAAFGTSEAFWMNLQTDYDLRRVDRAAVRKEVTPVREAL
jgi:addiction module HigA family antidote